MNTPPATQHAVQLVGPNELVLNEAKAVMSPGPHQLLCRVEVVGLCFSDLKLLKQFSGHVRKSDVIEGVEPSILAEVPSYVPNELATVPGHETVVTVIEIGEGVKGAQPGDRFLVQTDYRWLKTAQSNAAFGYNFEGALQEYVLMDQRVITSPEGESMLIPAADDLPASAVALVEPWACVEDSYVVRERQTLQEGGRLLIVRGDRPVGEELEAFLATQPEPAEIIETDRGVDTLEDESLDDVIFLGADADVLERVFPKLAKHGVMIIVQHGEHFGRAVNSPVGRLHYGGLRIVGTTGSDPARAMAVIPPTGEIREGDRIDIVGAGGPMGTMHVLRNLCQGVPGVSVFGGDMSDERLAMLDRLATPLAEQHGVAYQGYNAQTAPPRDEFDYIALMVPAPPLVEAAIPRGAEQSVINIFAGIPATVYHPLDLDTYVERRQYFIGTSGSDIEDMRIVLAKVEAGTLDTNLSVAAVSGLDGAVEGIRAVENQLMPGKIVVYPACRGLELTPLTELAETLPDVAAALEDGAWTLAAEQALLAQFN